MTNKKIYGLFDDDHKLINGVKALREKGFDIAEAYTPYPVHGLDTAMGIPRTRLAICSFIYGMTGVSLALLMTYFMSIVDWPMDIGGKPSYSFRENFTSFIPVTFESGVLLAAHGMAITFLLRSWLLPGVSPKNPDKRTTDDKFCLEMDAWTDEEEATIKDVLSRSGAFEVNTKS
ncbi:MAG: DUF3341 domain-containing protein [Flavobacteriales bacterium]|nr:DUF3341 domain-containing protein [Flavobacteriales bacterium]